MMKLVGLERRVSRQGKDSIDHSPGGHDDVANAVAGYWSVLIWTRRPALLRANDLLINEQPAPMPIASDAVFAVLAADDHGAIGVVYAALSIPGLPPPLRLLDFHVGEITATLWSEIADKLRELARICRAKTALHTKLRRD